MVRQICVELLLQPGAVKPYQGLAAASVGAQRTDERWGSEMRFASCFCPVYSGFANSNGALVPGTAAAVCSGFRSMCG